mmetsp:Transcript_43585/g.94730  ORF Transcript_43585/g.94730 Transcript_43585/m.94730 type:complete len:105 (+) Transcript_43585:762-1076(+)
MELALGTSVIAARNGGYQTKPRGVISHRLPLKRASEGLKTMTAGASVRAEQLEVQVATEMVQPRKGLFQALELALECALQEPPRCEQDPSFLLRFIQGKVTLES